MSRRYGRNQKRRHREQIASLSSDALVLTNACSTSVAKHAFALNKCKQLQATIEQLQAAIDHAIGTLGEGHIACPPAEREMPGQWIQSGIPMQLIPRPSLPDLLAISPDLDATDTVRVHILHRLLVNVDTSAWSDSFHAHATLHGRRVGYSMSKQSIEVLSCDQLSRLLTTEIAPDLAKGLAKALKRPPLYEE
jgi:hypothetical protein